MLTSKSAPSLTGAIHALLVLCSIYLLHQCGAVSLPLPSDMNLTMTGMVRLTDKKFHVSIVCPNQLAFVKINNKLPCRNNLLLSPEQTMKTGGRGRNLPEISILDLLIWDNYYYPKTGPLVVLKEVYLN